MSLFTALRAAMGAFFVISLLSLASSPSLAQTNAIEDWAAERETNFFSLPEEWRQTQPVTLRVSFRLKAEPGSPEAEDFLATMQEQIDAMTYHTRFKIEPVVVPSKYQYANTLEFGNLETWRAYETSQPLLDFFYSHWRDAVEESEEMLTISPRD